MNILECSSKGDKRFSAFYAKITLGDKYDSIENHYQLSKRFGEFVPKTWRDAKGKKPTHLCILGHNYALKYTTAFYDLLWCNYLMGNPILLAYAKQYDDYSDMFKSKKAIVCQADSIRKFIKKGFKGVLNEHSKFVKALKEGKDLMD